MHFNEGEFALSRDLMVDLWLQSRQYDKMRPLREVCGGDFVICNHGFYESFMEFKKGVIYQNDLRIVEQVDLLTYWIKTCKITSIKDASLMDKAYIKRHLLTWMHCVNGYMTLEDNGTE